MNEFMYPQSPSVGKQPTSREAAESIAPRVPTLRERAYALVCEKPCSADSAAEAMGESVLSVRPRFSELVVMNMIVDSGQREKNRFNRNCIIYAPAPAQASLFKEQ